MTGYGSIGAAEKGGLCACLRAKRSGPGGQGDSSGRGGEIYVGERRGFPTRSGNITTIRFLIPLNSMGLENMPAFSVHRMVGLSGPVFFFGISVLNYGPITEMLLTREKSRSFVIR